MEEVIRLMAYAEKLKRKMTPKSLTQTDVINGLIISKTIEQQTYSVPEAIHITIEGLYDMCTKAEWHLIGRISCDLFLNNCLWYCGPDAKRKNGNMVIAIKGLLEKNILINTDKPHFYIVNPKYLRKGNLIFTLITTAKAIYDNNGIDSSLLAPLRTVKEFYFSGGGTDIDMLSASYGD